MAFLQSHVMNRHPPPLGMCLNLCPCTSWIGWLGINYLTVEWAFRDLQLGRKRHFVFLFDKNLIQSKQTCMTLTLQGSHPSNVYKPHSQYQYPPSSPSTDFIPTPFPPPKNCRESQLHQPNVPFRVFWARFLAVDLRVEHKCFQERG